VPPILTVVVPTIPFPATVVGGAIKPELLGVQVSSLLVVVVFLRLKIPALVVVIQIP